VSHQSKIALAFDDADGEYLKFERIEKPRHPRRDIAAFILLAELVPGTKPIVAASEHDEFYLETDCDALAAAATQEHIVELARCGVRYDGQYDCLAMFS
jgi:hypothetical protein